MLLNNRPVFIYDIECYPNVFTLDIKQLGVDDHTCFEISDRTNHGVRLMEWLQFLRKQKAYMVGYNNVGYDYPVIHTLIQSNGVIEADQLYAKSMSIFTAESRWSHIIKTKNQYVEQLDPFLIHHFDTKNRSTSLKVLEFNMRFDKIQDLPYVPGSWLTSPEIDKLIEYNAHDTDATEAFYLKSIKEIEFRLKISEQFGENMMNYNDTKIGKQLLINRLEGCYTNGKKNQTFRASITLKDVILPYIQFETKPFQDAMVQMKNKVITNTKGSLNICATVNGFDFSFGKGGMHVSVESQSVIADEQYTIRDIDVAGYYPSLAVANGFYPQHLGQEFVVEFAKLIEERSKFRRDTPENRAYKLAGNGSYGASNDIHSPLYDPQFTMSITINGQLLLCMLAEQLMKIPNLSMIQVNTDGLTVKLPRAYLDHMSKVCEWWESITKLTLEANEYNSMFIRDVNSYIAEKVDGSIKRIGAYEYDVEWHQDHSMLIVPRITEQYLLRGGNIFTMVQEHKDVMDFMCRVKVPRKGSLVIETEYGDIQKQNVTRYYVSTQGFKMFKITPPKEGNMIGAWKRASKLTDEQYQAGITYGGESPDVNNIAWNPAIHTKNKSKYKLSRTAIRAGRRVIVQNDMTQVNNIDYDFYIKEIEKLVSLKKEKK